MKAEIAVRMVGIWHCLTGRYAKVKVWNERETLKALSRDSEKSTSSSCASSKSGNCWSIPIANAWIQKQK